MFTEIVTTSRAVADRVLAGSRLVSDPPAGLLAAIAWESGTDRVSLLMVWDTPAARGDFSFERMVPLLRSAEFADVTDKPQRVAPVEVYLRSG